jgi:hypothetical protein
MDKPFLKLMSECYVNDVSNDVELNSNIVFEYITNAFDEFKIKYSDYLEELYSKSRSYQQDLIYIILDNKFNSNSIIEQTELDLLFTEEFPSFGQIGTHLKNMISKSKLSPENEFLFGVIEKNHDNCNRTCVPGDIPLKNDQLLTLIRVNGKLEQEKIFQKLINLVSRKQNNFIPDPKSIYTISKCLRLCYLDYMTSVYAEGIINYDKCTKELGSSNNRDSINSYTDILKMYPMDDDCVHIFTYLGELFSDINKMLDIVYNNDSIRKRSWLKVIDDKIRAYRSGKRYVLDFSKIDDEYVNPNEFVRTI